MQRPTLNAITQTAHLNSNAVDYNDEPDPDFYAPEDGKISAYIPNNGGCGNNLKLRSGDHEHSFCHLERPYVVTGRVVKRGQRLGKMGYTGYTQPDNVPAGTHLHHFVRFDNGKYIYPPSISKDSFIKLSEGEEDMRMTDPLFRRFWSLLGLDIGPEGRQPTEKEVKEAIGFGNSQGRDVYEFLDWWSNTTPVKQEREQAALFSTVTGDLLKKIVELEKTSTNEAQDKLNQIKKILE